jgi:hypothetical protein
MFKEPPKAIADNLGGPEIFKMTVQTGQIPTPPTVAAALISAVVHSTVYDEHGEVVSAIASKLGSKLAKNLKLGESGCRRNCRGGFIRRCIANCWSSNGYYR